MTRKIRHRLKYKVSIYQDRDDLHVAPPDVSVLCDTIEQAMEVAVAEMRRPANRHDNALIRVTDPGNPFDPNAEAWMYFGDVEMWARADLK